MAPDAVLHYRFGSVFLYSYGIGDAVESVGVTVIKAISQLARDFGDKCLLRQMAIGARGPVLVRGVRPPFIPFLHDVAGNAELRRAIQQKRAFYPKWRKGNK
jgi:hypothetical protein